MPATVGDTFAVPLTDLAPAQPSPDCPPLARHVATFDEVQVRVTGLPTVMVAGAAANVTAGTMPVPPSATVCVPAPPPALMLSVAAADPAEAGLNTTLIVQVPATATEVPQVLVWANGCEPALERLMLVIGSATEPVFVTVTDLGTLATFVN